MVNGLLDQTISKKIFHECAIEIYHKDNFPNAKKWLQWYLHFFCIGKTVVHGEEQ